MVSRKEKVTGVKGLQESLKKDPHPIIPQERARRESQGDA